MDLTQEEITYIMTAMQSVSAKLEAMYQQQCNCDSRKLYAKLYDTWETLETNHAN